MNYWTPLTSRVDELENEIPPKPPPKQNPQPTKASRVKFDLPTKHLETNGKVWCESQILKINSRRPYEKSYMRRKRCHCIGLTKTQMIEGITNGTIASGVSDTGATSTAGKPGDPFATSKTKSTKTFRLPTGGTTTSTHQAELLLPVRAPANVVDVVPTLEQTLISGSKFADAGYTAVYDEHEVNFYEANKVKIDAKSVLRGYRCSRTGLWRVSLPDHILNENTDTLLLDAEGGEQSLNRMYGVPTSKQIRDHLSASEARDPDSINNVYELPSMEQSVRYLHGAAGFPTKAT